MKKLLALILLIAVMSHLLNKLVVVAAFELQQDYIASELCVNKDKPEMECHGHCQLDKKLQEDEGDTDQPATPVFKDIFNLSPFLATNTKFQFSNNLLSRSHWRENHDLPANLFAPDIFHPPS